MRHGFSIPELASSPLEGPLQPAAIAAHADSSGPASQVRLDATAPRPAARPARPFHQSLRFKGVVAVLVLLGYLSLIAVFVGRERSSLVSIVQEIERNQTAITLLESVVDSLARSLVDTQAILNAPIDRDPLKVSQVQVELGRPGLEELNIALEQLRMVVPALSPDIENFRMAAAAFIARPSPMHLAQTRDGEQVLLVKVQEVMRRLQRNSAELAQDYRAKQQFLGVFAIAGNVLGVVASVVVILVFFTRLARDIDRLQNRAAAIVAGYDGEPLRNPRRDEVGGLIDAVNQMQVDLRQWERQQELTRQQRFHQEKMAAVGSVASAIGHEVSNPIAAISGMAQFIVDECADDKRPQSVQFSEFAHQILIQTERISHILRQLANLTAQRAAEPELLDVNALVRSTCGFTRFDKRFRQVRFEEDLDPGLPAVNAVSDHITQILINLLINAVDAFEGVDDRVGTIRVRTHWSASGVSLAVSDNGHGMSPAVLAKAFDESFTTKPPGRGRGIGLFICKSLIEKSDGRIDLSSTPGKGTTATVCFPLASALQEAA